jgi:hypothetical protein
MAMIGNLKDMSVADLIQHNCQDQKTGLLTVEFEDQKAKIFFHNGEIVHATQGNLVGEEAVYKTLGWIEGKFVLEIGTLSPTVSIKRSWSGLLLEGARRQDETEKAAGINQSLADDPTQKALRLNDTLVEFLSNSKIFQGALVTDVVGNVRAACLQQPVDQELLTMVVAAILSAFAASAAVSRLALAAGAVCRGVAGRCTKTAGVALRLSRRYCSAPK